MIVVAVLVSIVAVIALSAVVHRLRQPRMWMIQWGKFTNSRSGIKGHRIWADESDVVQFDDYKYWIRFKPNPGVNLPIFGYWSKEKGRSK